MMVSVVISYLAGSLIGLIYFAGLWLTISKGLASSKAWLWFLASFVLRLGVALTGFYFVAAGQWQRLAGCLLGFVVIRFFCVKRIQATTNSRHAS